MKYRLHQQRIEAPADDSQRSGNAIKIGSPSAGPINDESDDAGDSGVSNRDLDVFNAYHKLDQRTGERRGSTLGKFANQVDEEEEDGKEDSKEETFKQEDTFSKDDTKKELTDQELLDLDETKLVNAKGQQVSSATSATIKKFKESLTKKTATIAELEEKLKAGPQLTEESPEIKLIKEENAKLKKQIDDEYFEKSDAFKQAFVAPVQESINKLNQYFTHLTEDDGSAKELNSLFAKAGKAAKAGDRVGFAKLLDEIAEDHVDGGTAMKSVFGSDMLEWFKLTQAHEKAFSDKNEDRKKIVTRTLAEQRRSNVSSIDRDIQDSVSQFEFSKKAVLDGLEGEEKENYTKLYKDRFNKVTESIGEFSITGKVNKDLTDVINDGVIAPALKHELNIAWAGFKDSMNKVSMLEKELAEVKARLGKVSREPGERIGARYTNTTSSKPTEKPRSRIFAALSGAED
jgi:hypothetical protein